MKKIDRLLSADVLNTLLTKLYDFRAKYRIQESAMWDLLTVYWYTVKTSKGPTLYQLQMDRYRRTSGMQAIQNRRTLMIKKGLLYISKNRTYLTELGLSEISGLTKLGLDAVVRSTPCSEYPVKGRKGVKGAKGVKNRKIKPVQTTPKKPKSNQTTAKAA